MSAYKTIGSQVQLIFQTRFPTFTADQFGRALKDKNYVISQAQIALPQNPNAPVIANVFSKGNMNVFISPNANQIFFQLLNTIDPQKMLQDEIMPILLSLNIVDDAIFSISFTCTTTVNAVSEEPGNALTSLVKEGFLKEMSSILAMKLGVTSIRLATSFPLEAEGGLQIVVEPLGTSPKKKYYLSIAYITANEKEFTKFINSFGEKMIFDVIERINQHD